MKSYSVEVQTGSVDSAGTDAKVYIQLFGEKATSTELTLDSKEDNFEKGKLDKFTVQSEDLGWLDRIRIFHTNSGDKPGWFVNYVKITDTQVGLSWRIDLNRWLSKKDDDKKIDITGSFPVENVQLSAGVMKSVYLGFIPWRYINEGQSKTNATNKFSYTYKKGVTVDVTNTKAIKLSVSLEATYFGVGGKFGTEVSQTVSKRLATTEEETYQMAIDFSYEVAAGESITVALVFYQHVLQGEVQAGGVNLNYEQKFLLSYQTMVFDGVLTDAQVAERIKDMLMNTTKSKLPVKLPTQNANVAIEEVNMKVVDKLFVSEVLQKMPLGVAAPSMQNTSKGMVQISKVDSQTASHSVKVN